MEPVLSGERDMNGHYSTRRVFLQVPTTRLADQIRHRRGGKLKGF